MATTPSAGRQRRTAPRKPASAKSPRKPGAVPTDADLVDQQLARYRSMRDFGITAEPSGEARDGTAQALPFCIQKHAASHLHYDFRLGWNGVLKSWACAKGPSYVPSDRRLAVQVEDHPMEYGGFEGIIPAGQYGGGTVMLWDQGTWEPQPGHEDIDAGLRAGSLKFLMHGEKIKGKWTLVRMGGKAATESKPNWLLIKEHDEWERTAADPAITEAEPNSVVTGRTMEGIAGNEDHVWNSKETAGTGQAWYRQVAKATPPPATATSSKTAAAARSAAGIQADAPPAAKRRSPSAGASAKRSAAPAANASPAAALPDLADLPAEAQPSFIKPQLASEATEPPEGDDWLHELKLDGYRIQARKSGDTVEMLTRSGLDWSYRVPAMARAVARLAPKNVTLDGEVVVLADDGTTNFARLQASFQDGEQNPLTYFCFDLLHLEGRNPRGLSLLERKQLLSDVLKQGDGDEIRLSEHIRSNGAAMFRSACELHAEGILSKRVSAPYHSGRNTDWLKSKCLREQEFVVGGFTLSSDGPDRIGSLLIGYYAGKKLVYAGRTGTGFTQKLRRSLRSRLEPLEQARTTFTQLPADARRDALWVRPDLVAQVRFATWTADHLVRQAAFLGLREDKAPTEVVREAPTVAPKPKSARGAAKASTATSAAASAATISALAGAKFNVRPRRPEASLTAAPKRPVAKSAMAGAAGGAAADFSWAQIDPPPVRLTHPAKVLDLESGVTKQVLASYYWAVADRMLPHIAGRPLSLVRCPEGSAKPCFYQKHVNHMLPEGVGSVPVPDKKTGQIDPYITLDSKSALAGLAQMGVLEIHPWGSRNDDLEHADRIVFDLDPDEALGWSDVTAAAAEVRKRLKARGLESFLKTTGGKGLHIVVPILPTLDWTAIKVWTHCFVAEMERAAPARYLTKMTKAARTGKIYLDYLRNERGATAVAPYSPRARSGLGVSLPLAWSELHAAERPLFRVANFPEWRARLKRDPWVKMASFRQTLPGHPGKA